MESLSDWQERKGEQEEASRAVKRRALGNTERGKCFQQGETELENGRQSSIMLSLEVRHAPEVKRLMRQLQTARRAVG